MSLATALQPLRARWRQLSPRDQNLVRLAAVLVLGLLAWQFSLKPAIATLRTADAQARVLEAQLQQMRVAQAQVQTLQKQPPLDFDAAARALTATTQQTLGTTAQLSMVGDRASVTLKDASPDALADWLIQARLNARSVPLEARLVRAAAPGGVSWSGTVMMGLPPR
ncbi:MAG: type II secretion system protein M [Pseudomonadota bacterium]|nr:type II secretion system protein M [Pseudomonadota bacterium]